MKTWSFAPCLLMAGILFLGMNQGSAAEPAPAPEAPKPKLAPRAIPGMADALHDGQGHAHGAPVASGTVMTSKPKPAAPIVSTPAFKRAVASGDTARILYIYRRGTVELPSAPVPTSQPAPKSAAADINASSSIVPRPGQVRIISKADADMLLAQPELQK